ncbi:hypothetical protein FOXB_08212 [Fusarium oxysporum f. sp. conglutinans Fo5176]|uniref:Uncharacterized protein n=1 Tax=Fusarium oxysporum (strain Fo5176) TaxID=660025 RepID=F9FP82_FUSOF|nr:hypothetical protein FOXB_08212 [Fusarium oxysporum f. sp. conglutinans Fo5176]
MCMDLHFFITRQLREGSDETGNGKWDEIRNCGEATAKISPATGDMSQGCNKFNGLL